MAIKIKGGRIREALHTPALQITRHIGNKAGDLNRSGKTNRTRGNCKPRKAFCVGGENRRRIGEREGGAVNISTSSHPTLRSKGG